VALESVIHPEKRLDDRQPVDMKMEPVCQAYFIDYASFATRPSSSQS
jgi:hypothetical protein